MIKNLYRKIINLTYKKKIFDVLLNFYFDCEIERFKKMNDFRQFGEKYYSQGDEDGIIEKINEILEIKKGFFLEIGCGNGTENNTHYLILNDWKGIWIDADKKNIKYINDNITKSPNLTVIESYVTPENIKNIPHLNNIKSVDFLSLDIDSNDSQVLDSLLKSIDTKFICVEYNSKLGSSGIYKNKAEAWCKDDYQGASFKALEIICNKYGYKYLCSTISGVNLFFVKGNLFKKFRDYSINKPSAAKYFLAERSVGHQPSLNFINQIFQAND